MTPAKKLRTWLFLLNYYAHDFFTGVWGASFLVMAILQGRVDSLVTQEAAGLADDLLTLFFRLEVVSLVLISVTGMGRAFDPNLGYRGEGARREKRLFLMVKHVVMGFFFVSGTLLSYGWAK